VQGNMPRRRLSRIHLEHVLIVVGALGVIATVLVALWDGM